MTFTTPGHTEMKTHKRSLVKERESPNLTVSRAVSSAGEAQGALLHGGRLEPVLPSLRVRAQAAGGRRHRRRRPGQRQHDHRLPRGPQRQVGGIARAGPRSQRHWLCLCRPESPCKKRLSVSKAV